ncbi:MAG: hypothetical protein CMB63_04590 [Euryarchaeota archaeon]|nr:hypothetical protein [Euryarchaeota archaeon]
MRSLLAVLMLVISGVPIGGVQAEAAEDGSPSSFDVVLMGDRQTESVSATLQGMIAARVSESSIEAITGESLGMTGHLSFYMEGLSPWQEELSTQSDYLLLQPEATEISKHPTSVGFGSMSSSMADISSIAGGMPSDPVLLIPWAHMRGDSSRPITHGNFQAMNQAIENGSIYLMEGSSSGIQFAIPADEAYDSVYRDVLESGSDPLDADSQFARLYESDGVNASEEGSYLISCTILLSLLDQVCDDSDRPPAIDGNAAAYLENVSRRVVDNMTDFNPPRSDSRPKIRLDNIPGGTYGIQPGSSIGITIFVHNYGEVSRSALLDIDLPEGWDWEWSDPMVQPGARVISIDSDVGIPISALIHAPDPGPFAPEWESVHYATVTVLDEVGGSDEWSFGLEVGRTRDAGITSGGESLSMPPGSIAILEVGVLNKGNGIDNIDVGIVGQGDVSTGVGTGIISQDGWGAILLDSPLTTGVGPWEEVVVRIQLASSGDSSGFFDFEIRVAPSSGTYTDSVQVGAMISTRISGAMDVDSNDCSYVEPGDGCSLDLTIRNEGEGRTTYSVNVDGAPSWIGTDGVQMVEIEGGEESKITLDIEIGSESPANDDLGIEIRLMTQGLIIDSESIVIGIRSEAEIVILDTTSCTADGEGELLLAATISNIGMESDYVDLSIDLDRSGEHGIIVESSRNNERSIRIGPVLPGESVNIGGWTYSSSESVRMEVSASTAGNPSESINAACTFSEDFIARNEVSSSSLDMGLLQSAFLILISLLSVGGLFQLRSTLKRNKSENRASEKVSSTITAEEFSSGFKRTKEEKIIQNREEIARSNLALDKGIVDDVIEEIDGLPKENRIPKQHDSMPPTDSVEDLIKDLME